MSTTQPLPQVYAVFSIADLERMIAKIKQDRKGDKGGNNRTGIFHVTIDNNYRDRDGRPQLTSDWTLV